MTELRSLIAAGDPVARFDAFGVAVRLSLNAIREQLDEAFLDRHAAAASAFFQAWLPRLEPFERMQAAEWVAGEYLLSMVHIPDAYALGARVQLEAAAGAAAALAGTLTDFGAFADGPDAGIDAAVPERLERLAPPVREVAEKLAAEVDGLPRA
ncbi:hypothetical protein [Actinoplanes couchii]|uniref:hypothetical protein n=1 Tax=Actinoplanes couchii TaxID=403638 RepID=UPI00194422EB|nr:hypothetical protein [Actinoplanes couchii]MDR6321946.1 hypothetical protein [Actinoplanes couchii]